jgi:hypothetical protein
MISIEQVDQQVRQFFADNQLDAEIILFSKAQGRAMDYVQVNWHCTDPDDYALVEQWLAEKDFRRVNLVVSIPEPEEPAEEQEPEL